MVWPIARPRKALEELRLLIRWDTDALISGYAP